MNKADQKRLLREMIFYRRFEERCFEAYMEHKIGGFLHLYAGQEAVATGVLEMAKPGHDYVITGYRDHVHAIKAGAPASFWTSIGKTPADYGALTWQNFFANNLLPVTLGNIIGGALLVGAVYWFVYLRPRSLAAASPQVSNDSTPANTVPTLQNETVGNGRR